MKSSKKCIFIDREGGPNLITRILFILWFIIPALAFSKFKGSRGSFVKRCKKPFRKRSENVTVLIFPLIPGNNLIKPLKVDLNFALVSLFPSETTKFSCTTSPQMWRKGIQETIGVWSQISGQIETRTCLLFPSNYLHNHSHRQGEHRECPPPKLKICCRKKIFPEDQFLATTYPKIDKNAIFLLKFYQEISTFSENFPTICIFRTNARKIYAGFLKFSWG